MDFGITISLAVLVAVVIGLVQVAKMIGLPTKFAPLLSVGLGVLGAIGLSFFEVNTTIVVYGLIVGLMASGLYSGVKTTMS
ncbi:MAG: putative holin [Siphoviridae sp. cttb18]|nr:MAG: putative holin [Siphoviridae sp. cttb18]